MTTAHPTRTSSAAAPDWLALVREQVEGLAYGVVQIVVHDHRVTQIERTEKTRLDAAPVRPVRGEHS